MPDNANVFEVDNNQLGKYAAKRNFNVTSEPEGKKTSMHEKPIFVIQKHHARSLHYDFRIETEGVLASWAIPKGPSMDPAVRRLAVQTEDHPMEYADFEGVIPEGEYGAGTVIVWDNGIFENISEKDGKAVTIRETIEKGHVSIVIAGHKLKGSFSLVRTNMGKQPQWLFMKLKDPYAEPGSDITKTHPDSVLTGHRQS